MCVCHQVTGTMSVHSACLIKCNLLQLRQLKLHIYTVASIYDNSNNALYIYISAHLTVSVMKFAA